MSQRGEVSHDVVDAFHVDAAILAVFNLFSLLHLESRVDQINLLVPGSLVDILVYLKSLYSSLTQSALLATLIVPVTLNGNQR